MKAPGKRAQADGTKLKRRAALQVVCHPWATPLFVTPE
jgi:hypothetical protein